MPLHEYLCTSCGRTFEAIQSFGEAPLATCNRCGGALKRLISAPAVQFKGGGWYVSDYGRLGSSPKNPETGKSEGGKYEAGKSEAGKSEAGKSEGGKSEGGAKEAPAGGDAAPASPKKDS